MLSFAFGFACLLLKLACISILHVRKQQEIYVGQCTFLNASQPANISPQSRWWLKLFGEVCWHQDEGRNEWEGLPDWLKGYPGIHVGSSSMLFASKWKQRCHFQMPASTDQLHWAPATRDPVPKIKHTKQGYPLSGLIAYLDAIAPQFWNVFSSRGMSHQQRATYI